MPIREFKELSIPYLKVAPCTEAPLMKRLLGFDFIAPTRVTLTDDNKEAIKNSKDPSLMEGVNILRSSEINDGIFISLYNTALMKPGLRVDINALAERHEVSHSIHGQIEMATYGYITDYGLHPSDMEKPTLDLEALKDVYGIFSEGMANWLTFETILRGIGLEGKERKARQYELANKHIDIVLKDQVQSGAHTPYALGHFFMCEAMTFLQEKRRLSTYEALKLLVKYAPRTAIEVSNTQKRREYLTMLALSY